MAKPDIDQLLQKQWQASQPFIAVDLGKLRARQQSQKQRLWAEIFFAALSFGIGLMFWWQGTSTLTDVAAAVMIVSGIGSGVLAARARKPLLDWENWTPEGILEYRLKETEAALKLVRSAVYAAVLLCLFSVYLWWGSRFTPGTVTQEFALLYSGFSVPAILATLGWAGWRRQKLLERRREISIALQSFQD